jgi:hypothetical protein
MPAIASTGAMLSSGHQRHQLEVGLSLPNLIQTSLTRLGALGQVFGTSDPDEAARSTALIERDFSPAKGTEAVLSR